MLVGLLRLGPLCAEAKLLGLEDEIGQLPSRDLVLVDLRVWPGKVGLEWGIHKSQLRPVRVDGSHLGTVHVRVGRSTLKGREHSAHAWLRGHAGHAISRSVHSIRASVGAGHHRRHARTRGIMSMDVDRKVGILLSDRSDQESSGLRFEHASHILDTQHMGPHLHNSVD